MIAKEIIKKLDRINSLLEIEDLDGLLINQRDNFSWITGGGINWVDKSTQDGVVDLLIMKDKKYVIASQIEKYRTTDEEIRNQGYELIEYNWYEDRTAIIKELITGKKVASDSGILNTKNLYSNIQHLRFVLLDEEILRLKKLSRETATVMNEICRQIKKGESEQEIGAKLTFELMKKGIQAPVCLIAADGRIGKYRHPVPKENKVKKYVMVVVGAEKYGLVISITRLVSFGRLPDDIILRHKACLEVDATLINNTVIGAKVSDVLKSGIEIYKKTGFQDEWKLHHQGGAAGYKSREYIATLNCKETVHENQIFAWNPSIAGTKSEDTILVTKYGQEILTEMDNWPMRNIRINGKIIKRPDILIK